MYCARLLLSVRQRTAVQGRSISGSARFISPVLSLASDYFVAFARGLFQVVSVHNGYRSPCVRDQTRPLKNSSADGYTCPPGTQHVRKKFLRQGDQVATNPVLAHEQPARQSLRNFVKAIAGSNLHGLHPQFLRVAI